MLCDVDNINPTEIQALVFVMFTVRTMNLATIHQRFLSSLFSAQVSNHKFSQHEEITNSSKKLTAFCVNL